MHPHGGCSFARHGTYQRVCPPGTRIPRWYCPQSHRTFSVLADCFAARLSGTLCQIEALVDQVEQAPSLEAAVKDLRPQIGLPGILRWTRRRVQSIHGALRLLKGLMPGHFLACEPTVASFRRHLEVDPVLPALREMAAVHVPVLPPPFGFRPPCCAGGEAETDLQQQTGPDPPSLVQ